ncbi:hypothetical protein OBBRIDRAFT_808762, partial [Obba rivulosa]
SKTASTSMQKASFIKLISRRRSTSENITECSASYSAGPATALGQLQCWDSYSREKTDKAGQIRRELLETCRAAAGIANEEEPYEEAGGGISDSELKAFEDTE